MRPAAAVLVAAGAGERLGPSTGGRPKAFVQAGGRSLLEHALERLESIASLQRIVVVHPPGESEAARCLGGRHHAYVPGGATRVDSVRAGVGALSSEDDVELVAIHDAARPLVPVTVIEAVLAAVTGDVIAAAPGLPVADTLKRVVDGDVTATVDRSGLWMVQTPQVVRREILEIVLAEVNATPTDDLGMVERALRAGTVTGRIAIIDGDPLAMKVTRPTDLAMIDLIARATSAGPAT